ncbi:antiviral reverse transcriptase Drt3b [Burkholderia cenocepacia]|uniref:antiviral reverse transcriptase Drt3b n=1 Tax=Burkholderia cenocepacia TaxID=95486 RepID=UPI001B9D861E|nr:antiviral reverse transcriptase Drt3b [Burkholderia cenocepacia]MBR8136155.1 RNA-directed DNA polymerase [Burkholderia cenocepacia]
MTKSLRQIKKEDYARVILTETPCYDVPVTFSNVGFYWHWKKHQEGKSFFPDVMDYLFCNVDINHYTTPLPYKIRKDSRSYRHLALVHPITQINFIDFYKTFDQQIILACKDSPFSIRCPETVASKYYVHNKKENTQKFKSEGVTTKQSETKSRYLSSYFAYRGYNRLHHFFDSQEFITLERKYSSFWSLDISKCFDSIYTHSITWALKTKPHSKSITSIKNTFGSVFDTLMQRANYNETAGIVIGPEISRIFAEIILQRIDKDILTELQKPEHHNLRNGVDYTIRRYVDDIFIFSLSEEISEIVAKVVENCLKSYKLNINSAKTNKASRPFITQKSRSLLFAKRALQPLVSNILTSKNEQHERTTPKRIYRRKSLIASFLNEVKSACIESTEAYELVSGYLISALSNLAISFCEKDLDQPAPENENKKKYVDFLKTIIELIFHFYTISPSQNGSIKICILTNIACKYISRKIPDEANEIRSLIYTLGNDFFSSSGFKKISNDNSDFALLEALNILVALKLLGRNFLVSRSVLEKIVNIANNRRTSYFEITTLMFYIGDDPEGSYNRIKEKITKDIDHILQDLSDIKSNSEKAYLLLDILTCPFVSDEKRRGYIKKLLAQVTQSQPSDHVVLEYQKKFAKYRWFTSWNQAELLASLEKKALLKSY